jgi:tetratricopeptide (TPR) repeat protein
MAKLKNRGCLVLSLAAMLVLQGCLTTTSSMRQARELFNAGDYDQAREVLSKAAAENPKNAEIKTLLFRAQLNSYQTHLFLARAKSKTDGRQAAILEYQKAWPFSRATPNCRKSLTLMPTPKKRPKQKNPNRPWSRPCS